MGSGNDDTKLLISCVGENDALYTSEVLLLFKTIKKFGGKVASNSKLVANFVKSIDPTIKQDLEGLGVEVRTVHPAEHARETTSNKIRMLELDDDYYDYDVLIALDCDTVVVRDFYSVIDSQFFQAMPVDIDLLTFEQWKKLFSYFGLDIQPERFNAPTKTIITYFSSAVMSIPKQYVKQIRNAWDKYFFGLFEYSRNLEELSMHRYFFEELALSLAIEKEKIQSNNFSMEMNFPTNFRVTPSLHPDNMSPFIVHYHHLFELDGSLSKTGYKIPDLAIQQVNEHFLTSEANNQNGIPSAISSGSNLEYQQQNPIARDARVLQKVVLAKQKHIQERERWIKVWEYWLNRSRKDIEILQNTNLDHKKSMRRLYSKILRDFWANRARKDIEILQNTNIGYQKTIEEKDKLIEQLNTQLKRAIEDVNTLQGAKLEYLKTIEAISSQLKQVKIY